MTDDNRAPDQGRRQFLAGGALLGAGLLASATAQQAGRGAESAVLESNRPDAPYDLALPQNTLYTACLQCNTGCGIKVKLQGGVVTKIDGNPYNPWTLVPHLPFATHPKDAVHVDGAICPKGQSGLQSAYDPYRIRKVLKRAGKRGENRWISIPFDQAIEEICEGGRLFANVPGEENRVVEGLRQLVPLRDGAAASAMAADVRAIWNAPDQTTKRRLVEEFKVKHAAHLGTLIDPDHPDLGPKNNQIVLAWGRLKAGRGDFYRRFAAGLGTPNAHGHTTVCQGSLYFACQQISDQYVDGSFSGGQKFYWQADLENSKFVIFAGANLFDANYGPPNRTVRMTDNVAYGRTRIAVVDPRFSKLASKAWKWLPIKPGEDAALALGMVRWVLDNERYDARFLGCANRAAANAVGEKSWSNATWLVEIEDGQPGALVRAADHGLAPAETRPRASGAGEYQEKFMVVMQDGRPVAVDPNSTTAPVYGDLFVDTTLPDGTRVKSGLQILLESARERTVEEWAEAAGIRAEDLVDTAREFTSHGKAVAVDVHRGPSQHTNGFYGVFAWFALNMLVGNFDHAGGLVKPTTWDTMGRGGLFALSRQAGAISRFGISSIRHGVAYERTTLFEGYPAKRNWYQIASDVYQETIPSIGAAYPYPVKALFMYMGAPVPGLPAGHTNIDVLTDVEKLPLFIANDILVGMTSMYADYIFPDLSFLERWEFHGSHPSVVNKVQPVRQPVIPPVPEECTVFGETMPICFESMILGIAERLALPGFGADAFGPGLDLKHYDEFYLRGTANLAFGERTDGAQNVPDADEREMALFRNARRHLPATVYDEARWSRIVGERMWPKVVYILNRGGRFEDHARGYSNGMLTNAYARLLNLYQERTAGVINSGTGRSYPGYPAYVPVRDYQGREFTSLSDGYDLTLITHKTVTQTKTRTIGNHWLRPMLPENTVQVAAADARRLGLVDGQRVRVVSASNPRGEWDLHNGQRVPMIGRLEVLQGMRPGVVSFALGFGHWAGGAVDIVVDGHTVKGDPKRASGINANAAMWRDPTVQDTCIFDPLGGSASFYDSRIRLVPVTS